MTMTQNCTITSNIYAQPLFLLFFRHYHTIAQKCMELRKHSKHITYVSLMKNTGFDTTNMTP